MEESERDRQRAGEVKTQRRWESLSHSVAVPLYISELTGL